MGNFLRYYKSAVEALCYSIWPHGVKLRTWHTAKGRQRDVPPYEEKQSN